MRYPKSELKKLSNGAASPSFGSNYCRALGCQDDQAVLAVDPSGPPAEWSRVVYAVGRLYPVQNDFTWREFAEGRQLVGKPD